MSWFDNSSGRKAFLSRQMGAGGTVYSYSGKALILTSGIEEAQILWVSLCGSFGPGMALNSSHQDGVLCWQACHSSHISMSEIGGSSM